MHKEVKLPESFELSASSKIENPSKDDWDFLLRFQLTINEQIGF